jgi:DNA-binding NtrC family response regulator
VTAIRKVLVVDDDPAVSKSFDPILTRMGFKVVSAKTGLEALNKVAHEQYAALFIDIKMPGMDGIEVAARVHATQPSLPMAIMTGYGSADHRARAAAAGACDFLCKPLSAEMIETSLGAALEIVASPASQMAPRAALAVAPEPRVAAVTARQPVSVGERRPGRSRAQVAKDIALFFASPFITLAYLGLFPFIGLALLAQAWRRRKDAA